MFLILSRILWFFDNFMQLSSALFLVAKPGLGVMNNLGFADFQITNEWSARCASRCFQTSQYRIACGRKKSTVVHGNLLVWYHFLVSSNTTCTKSKAFFFGGRDMDCTKWSLILLTWWLWGLQNVLGWSRGCTESSLFDAVGNVVLPCHYVQKSFEMLFKSTLSVLGVGNPHFVLKSPSKTLCPPIL